VNVPKQWNLSPSSPVKNGYSPIFLSHAHQREIEFLRWFKDIDMLATKSWIIVDDFNLIRRPENRNKPGSDISLMMAFNEAISKLGVLKLPLSGLRNNKAHFLKGLIGSFSHINIGFARNNGKTTY
jgi:hypothetical protein